MIDALLGLGVLLLCTLTALAAYGTVRYSLNPKIRREVRVLWRLVQAIGFGWPAIVVIYTVVSVVRAVGYIVHGLLGG